MDRMMSAVSFARPMAEAPGRRCCLSIATPGRHKSRSIQPSLPAIGPVDVVREDPRQPGLLFAGVYFSIDDGDHWQSLRQNMPASSVRDLVIHDDDLVVGTQGRSISERFSVTTCPLLPPTSSSRWLPSAELSSPTGPYVHPGRYRVRLSAADLQLQSDLSLACYGAYQRLREIREAIDGAVDRQPVRREQLTTLRGSGVPESPDILDDSITVNDPNQETVVGLQQKLLFMLALLQSADARPTTQAADAVKRLTGNVPILDQRWVTLR